MIAILLCVACRAQRVEIDVVGSQFVKARLDRGVVKQAMRQDTVQELFTEAGCTARVQPVDGRPGNVICHLAGETETKIVVGAHFDFVDKGEGIVDNWSGASLLASLFQSLKNKPHHFTLEFVAFAAEERGLAGSNKYMRSLAKDEREMIRAYVNIDSIGMVHCRFG